MKKKIVVIEDEEPVRMNLQLLLESEEFEVYSAADGEEGLKEIASRKPDLVICDMMMPVVEGYEVLKRMRREESYRNIPFIFLTARTDKNSMRQGMELGADDYITKPFTMKEILNAVNIRLEKVELIEKDTEQKMNELRLSMVNSLPHEFITPLSSIIGYSDMLISSKGSIREEVKQEMLESIYYNALRLNRLTQNFLLLAELEILSTDKNKLKALRAEITEFAEEIILGVASSKARSFERSSDLQLDLGQFSITAPLASAYLAKITEELVDNAFRYSEVNQKVYVTARIQNGNFVMNITDDGRGLTQEQIAKIGIFIQFERKRYEQQGMGQGLSLVKRIVELHGGEFSVSSVPEKMTVARVLIPVKKP
ncbi:MAG: response regulator [Chloroflexi bacterium]|uniref:histidine kinase n=1 Tax=Candidatus Chlorohelix allophototropha TaxID=3003348 RepID=A0A8T7M557_9CHLR|nr:response regulator [Chloroflexota bacterium]WJW69110.1 response regulator [Chloroflexota bacterium L227-S17]